MINIPDNILMITQLEKHYDVFENGIDPDLIISSRELEPGAISALLCQGSEKQIPLYECKFHSDFSGYSTVRTWELCVSKIHKSDKS